MRSGDFRGLAAIRRNIIRSQSANGRYERGGSLRAALLSDECAWILLFEKTSVPGLSFSNRPQILEFEVSQDLILTGFASYKYYKLRTSITPSKFISK